MTSHARFRLRVERDLQGPRGVEIKLVRYELRRRWWPPLGRHRSEPEIVLFRRHFRPLLELSQLESYAALLERVVQHADQGTLGCFVETQSDQGSVEIALYERWFDGDKLRCELLADKTFDASDDSALVKSAEFRGELELWAEDQNAARDASYLAAADAEVERLERASERESAAQELARILARG